MNEKPTEQINFGSKAAFNKAAIKDRKQDEKIKDKIAEGNRRYKDASGNWHGGTKDFTNNIAPILQTEFEQNNARQHDISRDAINDSGYIKNDTAYQQGVEATEAAQTAMQQLRAEVESLPELKNQNEVLGEIDKALSNEQEIEQGLQKHSITEKRFALDINNQPVKDKNGKFVYYDNVDMPEKSGYASEQISDSRLKNIIAAASCGRELGLNV